MQSEITFNVSNLYLSLMTFSSKFKFFKRNNSQILLLIFLLLIFSSEINLFKKIYLFINISLSVCLCGDKIIIKIVLTLKMKDGDAFNNGVSDNFLINKSLLSLYS